MPIDNPTAFRRTILEIGKKGNLNQATEVIANHYTRIKSVPSRLFRLG